MVCVVMRHGRRSSAVDASLVGYNSTDLDHSSPEIWRSVNRVVQQGVPLRQIITSPYLRTRQTALMVQYSYLKLTGTYLPINVDVRLGEYAKRHCRLFTPSTQEFDKDTLAYYKGHVPLCRESTDALIQRVSHFYHQLPQDAIIVTHYGIADLLGVLAQQQIKLQEGHYAILQPVEQTQLINSPVV